MCCRNEHNSLYNGIIVMGRARVYSSPKLSFLGFYFFPAISPHPLALWRWPAFAGTAILGSLRGMLLPNYY